MGYIARTIDVALAGTNLDVTASESAVISLGVGGRVVACYYRGTAAKPLTLRVYADAAKVRWLGTVTDTLTGATEPQVADQLDFRGGAGLWVTTDSDSVHTLAECRIIVEELGVDSGVKSV